MPPKKKINGFMVFTLDWKSKYGKNMNMQQATTEAGKIWQNMTLQERGPFNERAKKEKMMGNDREDKLTCTGLPVAQVQKEKLEQENKERIMKRYIETCVKDSVKQCNFELQSYYFIMVNYFTKAYKNNIYVPAEISVAEFSLKDGVSRKYHTFINPGIEMYGLHHEALTHANMTHQLPLPPNAKGEKNMAKIYNDILHFVYDKQRGDYPPLYTDRSSIPIVKSVLGFMGLDSGAKNVELEIYSIQHLLFIMKETACEIGEVTQPKSHYVTDAYFERDYFEYTSGMACSYHEEIDKSKYCTQSYVTRWGFMFADYMCRDLAITPIKGRHAPESINMASVVIPAPRDTESFISGRSEISYCTKPMSEHKPYHDDDQRAFAGDDDFPTLGSSSSSSRKKSSSASPAQPKKTTRVSREYASCLTSVDNDDTCDLNPWTSRSRRPAREPDVSQFHIVHTQEDFCENEYSISDASYGRGRRLSENLKDISAGSGRGRFLHLKK